MNHSRLYSSFRVAKIAALALTAAVASNVAITDAAAQNVPSPLSVRATLPSPLRLVAVQSGQPISQNGLPEGADVSLGYDLEARQPEAYAAARLDIRQNDRGFGASLHGTGSVMHGLAGVGAATHQDVLLEVVLTRPMRVSFALQVETIQYTTAAIPVASIDIGNNGSIDLTTPALGGQNTWSITLELPAGTHPVRFFADTEILPQTTIESRLHEVHASLGIAPAHAEIAWEGTPCFTRIDILPMMDGDSVRVWVDRGHNADIPFLILGFARQNTVMPIAPHCPLLVSPDSVFPSPIQAYYYLPVAGHGPVTLFAQGAILSNQAGGVYMSQRIAIRVP